MPTQSVGLSQTINTASQMSTFYSQHTLIDSKREGEENYLVRLARVIQRVMSILSNLSLSEKEKITLIKKEIKLFTEIQAHATGVQGWIAVGTSVGGALFTGLSFIPGLGNFKEILPKIGDTLRDTTSRFVGSRYDMKSIKASSEREVLIRDMDNTNNDVQSKSSSRREVQDVLKDANETCKTASRSA